jgi:hypothetical protein
VAPLARTSVGFVLALALGVPRVARAEGAQQLSIAAVGVCPSAEEVTQELQLLLPDATLSLSTDALESDVIVSDRDAVFTVKVRGQRRRFRDAKRDCTERARHVAVFTVLIVDPLHVPAQASVAEEEPEPAEKPPAPPPRPLPPPPVQAAEPGTPFDLSLGPIAQVALKSDAQSTTQAGGLGLRLRYGRGVGVTLGLAGLLPSSLHYELAQARATWVPMDLGLSLSQSMNAWELGLDLGLSAALLVVEGQALDATQRASRLELGGRIGAQVRYWASPHAGICGGMFASYFPQPYSLQVEGLGVVGQTPSAWIGGSLGAVIRL